MSRGRIMEVAVKEPIVWEVARKGVPGKLTFDVIKDEDLGFHEGDAVRFDYGETKVFFGFVFIKKRNNNRIISVTAYDQLRYFKNKETYSYVGKTAKQVIEMVADDFKLKVGSIANTGHVITSRVEDNQELFTIVNNALDITTSTTGKMYVLYDDYGALTLKEVNQMKLDLLIDSESGESFDYTTSIDENTYNQIKLVKEVENEVKNGDNSSKEKKREVYIAKDTESQNQWGILQLTETIQNGENGKVKADALLALYNRKTRKLNISNVFGDIRVRAGCIIGVQLYLGDIDVSNYMMVDTVKHTFRESDHRMDLKVIGGEFIA